MSTNPRPEFLSQITGMRAIMRGAAIAEPTRVASAFSTEIARGQEFWIGHQAPLDPRYVSEIIYGSWKRERLDHIEARDALMLGGR